MSGSHFISSSGLTRWSYLSQKIFLCSTTNLMNIDIPAHILSQCRVVFKPLITQIMRDSLRDEIQLVKQISRQKSLVESITVIKDRLYVCKTGNGAAVHSLELYNSSTATVSSILCTVLVVVLEKLAILHKPKLNAQLH